MTTRAEFLRRAVVAGAAAPMLLGVQRRSEARGAPNTPANGRPNVLFILTDDQPAHTLSVMEKTLARFSDGLNLTEKAYVPVPLCGPDRVSLLTGRYPHNHGATGNRNAYNVYRRRLYAQNDLLSRLDRVGYRVGFFGKFINNYGKEDSGKWVHPGADHWLALAGTQMRRPYTVNSDGRLRTARGNHTPYFGERAISFIRAGAALDSAWYCQINWTDPHTPYTPPEAYRHTHDGERHTSPGTRETDFSDKSSYWRQQPKAGPRRQQDHYEGTTEELELVDEWVKRVFTALEETGQLGNTLVFYATDNGYMMGEHGGITEKQQPYEESTRTPFLVRGPASALNPERRGQLVSHLDITRTILGVAEADTRGVDGRDLRSSGVWRRRILVEHPNKRWAMLRDGDLVYMDFYDYGTAEEMYDLSTARYQLRSVHDDPLYADQKRRMINRLNEMRSAGGAELRALEEAE